MRENIRRVEKRRGAGKCAEMAGLAALLKLVAAEATPANDGWWNDKGKGKLKGKGKGKGQGGASWMQNDDGSEQQKCWD